MECLDGMDIPLDCIGLERSQEAIVLCQELTERIRICLQKLQPEQHDILARHYLHDETCAGIAATLGIATNALEQRLLRSRRKLYKLFTANGISVAEVSDYFSATTPPVLPHIVR